MSTFAMFCAGFEMNYGLLDVIIRKKQSVSAYAKESKNVGKVKILTQALKNSFMRDRKRREKYEKDQTVGCDGVSDCYGSVLKRLRRG
jgi:hypothetical protein